MYNFFLQQSSLHSMAVDESMDDATTLKQVLETRLMQQSDFTGSLIRILTMTSSGTSIKVNFLFLGGKGKVRVEMESD